MTMSERNDVLNKLRKRIYNTESFNQHKKEPKKDTAMVDEIIKIIKRQVDEEGEIDAD